MSPTEHTAPLLTSEAVAVALAVSVRTLSRWTAAGCPVIHLGKYPKGKGALRRYRIADVMAWLENRNKEGGAQ